MRYIKEMIYELRTLTPQGYVFFGLLFLLLVLLFARIIGA
jgi:hypothetical protein